jgi:hypothetical protein
VSAVLLGLSIPQFAEISGHNAACARPLRLTRLESVNPRCLMPMQLSGFRFVGYNQPLTSASGPGDLRCPPTNDARTVIGW